MKKVDKPCFDFVLFILFIYLFFYYFFYFLKLFLLLLFFFWSQKKSKKKQQSQQSRLTVVALGALDAWRTLALVTVGLGLVLHAGAVAMAGLRVARVDAQRLRGYKQRVELTSEYALRVCVARLGRAVHAVARRRYIPAPRMDRITLSIIIQ